MKSKLLILLFLSIFLISFTTAYVNIGGVNSTGIQGVVIQQPSISSFNNNTANVNNSQFLGGIAASQYAIIGSCAGGFLVQNITHSGVQCVPASSSSGSSIIPLQRNGIVYSNTTNGTTTNASELSWNDANKTFFVRYQNFTTITYTVGNVVSPEAIINAGAGNYNDCGNSFEYLIYAYYNSPGGLVYSSEPADTGLQTDPNNCFGSETVSISWTPLTGADGYRILIYNSVLGYNFDYYYDTGSTGFIDGDGTEFSFQSGSTVTPTSASTPTSINSSLFYNALSRNFIINASTLNNGDFNVSGKTFLSNGGLATNTLIVKGQGNGGIAGYGNIRGISNFNNPIFNLGDGEGVDGSNGQNGQLYLFGNSTMSSYLASVGSIDRINGGDARVSTIQFRKDATHGGIIQTDFSIGGTMIGITSKGVTIGTSFAPSLDAPINGLNVQGFLCLGVANCSYQLDVNGDARINSTNNLYFGSSASASIKYNNTDFLINPKVLGSGTTWNLGNFISSGNITSQGSVFGNNICYLNGTNCNLTASTINKTYLINQSGSKQIVSLTSLSSGNLTYRIAPTLEISAVSVDVLVLQVNYTTPRGTAVSSNFFAQGLTTASMSNVGVPQYPPMDINVKPNTNIILSAILTTGIGTINFDTSGSIQQI